jgi:hypothetical protein
MFLSISTIRPQWIPVGSSSLTLRNQSITADLAHILVKFQQIIAILGERFLDPVKIAVGNSFQIAQKTLPCIAIVRIHKYFAVTKTFTNAFSHIYVPLQAFFCWHPFKPATDFELKSAVASVVILLTGSDYTVQTARGILRLQIVEINGSAVYGKRGLCYS